MAVESTVWDVAHTMHAHPTISGFFLEAGADAVGKPVAQSLKHYLKGIGVPGAF